MYLVVISDKTCLRFLGAGGSESGRRFGGHLAGVYLLPTSSAATGSWKVSVGLPSGKC